MAIGAVLDAARKTLGFGPDARHLGNAGSEEKDRLVKSSSNRFVYDNGVSSEATDAEIIQGAEGMGIETVAAPPFEIMATVPEEHKEGEPVPIAGPHGPIKVNPPTDSKPGTSFKFRCVPRPEFRVEVPPDARPDRGLQIGLKRSDGVQVAINIPPHLKPGDIFEVMPPALMVRVPEGAQVGDYVVFRPVAAPGIKANAKISWLRAPVPEGAQPGVYFAVRVPGPEVAMDKKLSTAGGGNGALQQVEGRASPLLDEDEVVE